MLLGWFTLQTNPFCSSNFSFQLFPEHHHHKLEIGLEHGTWGGVESGAMHQANIQHSACVLTTNINIKGFIMQSLTSIKWG